MGRKPELLRVVVTLSALLTELDSSGEQEVEVTARNGGLMKMEIIVCKNTSGEQNSPAPSPCGARDMGASG